MPNNRVASGTKLIPIHLFACSKLGRHQRFSRHYVKWFPGWSPVDFLSVTGQSYCPVTRLSPSTVNRGYFERFLHSTLNIFFINCSTDINPTPYLGLNMGPSSFTLKKKLAPLKFLIFKILCCVQSCPTMGLLWTGFRFFEIYHQL